MHIIAYIYNLLSLVLGIGCSSRKLTILVRHMSILQIVFDVSLVESWETSTLPQSAQA